MQPPSFLSHVNPSDRVALGAVIVLANQGLESLGKADPDVRKMINGALEGSQVEILTAMTESGRQLNAELRATLASHRRRSMAVAFGGVLLSAGVGITAVVGLSGPPAADLGQEGERLDQLEAQVVELQARLEQVGKAAAKASGLGVIELDEDF